MTAFLELMPERNLLKHSPKQDRVLALILFQAKASFKINSL
jgi:hypothetical protein